MDPASLMFWTNESIEEKASGRVRMRALDYR